MIIRLSLDLAWAIRGQAGRRLAQNNLSDELTPSTRNTDTSMKTNLWKNLDPPLRQKRGSRLLQRPVRIGLVTAAIAGLAIGFVNSRFAQERPSLSANSPLASDDAATWAILNPRGLRPAAQRCPLPGRRSGGALHNPQSPCGQPSTPEGSDCRAEGEGNSFHHR